MEEDDSIHSVTGCKFAGRCPHVMDICKHAPPPLYKTDSERVSSCYLYDSCEILPNDDLGSLLHTKKRVKKSENGAGATP